MNFYSVFGKKFLFAFYAKKQRGMLLVDEK